jgi:hypothetical protein
MMRRTRLEWVELVAGAGMWIAIGVLDVSGDHPA